MMSLIRFLRIYTPFICTLMALLNGVLFIGEYPMGDFAFVASATTGNSILVDVYILTTSLKMCIWYKLNLLCLLLIQICGLLYHHYSMDVSLYVWVVTLLAATGIMFFLIFRVFYKVTSLFGCTRRRLRE